VDESEERRRWVPWVLLLVLILGAALAVYFVIRYAIQRDDNASDVPLKRSNLNTGELESFESCSDLLEDLRFSSSPVFIGDLDTHSLHTRWYDRDRQQVQDLASASSLMEGGVGNLQVRL
jgi:hypothetical protein